MGKFFKSAGLLNTVGKLFGYHDTNSIAKAIGWDQDNVHQFYHELGVPNKSLYSESDVIKDLSEMKTLKTNMNAMFDAGRHSPEGSELRKNLQEQFNNSYYAFGSKYDELQNKYKRIKNG